MNFTVRKPKNWMGKYLQPQEVETPGIDFGQRPLLWNYSRFGYLVLKIRGGMHWSGRGEQAYGSTYYQVCKITNETDSIWYVEEIIEVPARQK